jgi:glycosyltransferase involved in cell wall biosynthesis
LRVVYLCPVGFLGGAEWSLLDLMASVRAASPSADLHLVLGADGPIRAQARNLGITVHDAYIPEALGSLGEALPAQRRAFRFVQTIRRSLIHGPMLIRYTASFHRLLEQLRPDIIHSNGMKSHMLTCMTRDVGAPVIWHLRDYLSSRAVTKRVLSIGAKDVAAIAISQSIKADAEESLPFASVDVVYNAIDMNRFTPDGPKADLDGMAGLPAARAGTLRVGIIGTFARWKGQDVFLDAAARVSAALPEIPVRYYVVGDAIYKTNSGQFTRQELSERAANLGVGEHVGFTGHVADVERLYRSLDVVIHASTRPEPFGRTIAEAMASGRAVIVGGSGGAAELFTEGVDALGAKSGSADDLARAIGVLIRDESLRNRLAKNARESAGARFNRQRLGPEVMALYARILSQHKTVAAAAAS